MIPLHWSFFSTKFWSLNILKASQGILCCATSGAAQLVGALPAAAPSLHWAPGWLRNGALRTGEIQPGTPGPLWMVRCVHIGWSTRFWGRFFLFTVGIKYMDTKLADKWIFVPLKILKLHKCRHWLTLILGESGWYRTVMIDDESWWSMDGLISELKSL